MSYCAIGAKTYGLKADRERGDRSVRYSSIRAAVRHGGSENSSGLLQCLLSLSYFRSGLLSSCALRFSSVQRLAKEVGHADAYRSDTQEVSCRARVARVFWSSTSGSHEMKSSLRSLIGAVVAVLCALMLWKDVAFAQVRTYDVKWTNTARNN